MKALVLLGFSNTPSLQSFSMELINSAALPTSATVAKVMISPVPSRFTVIAAIDKAANFRRRQHAVIYTSCIRFRAHAAVTTLNIAKDELKPLVSFNP